MFYNSLDVVNALAPFTARLAYILNFLFIFTIQSHIHEKIPKSVDCNQNLQN